VNDPLCAESRPGDSRPISPGSDLPLPPSPKGLIFVPTSTPSMIQYPLQTLSKRIRRLRYRCVDTGEKPPPNRQLVFTWDYPTQPDTTTIEGADEAAEWKKELDRMMEKAERVVRDEDGGVVEPVSVPETETNESSDTSDMESAISNQSESTDTAESTNIITDNWPRVVYTSQIHTLQTAHFRLPDRPIDAHFAARSITPILPRQLALAAIPPLERLAGVREFFKCLEDRTLERGTKLYSPPAHLTVEIDGKDQRFALLADEECEIKEVEREQGVILRSIKSFEPGNIWSRPKTHTEVSTQHWPCHTGRCMLTCIA
jgi:hypothetical protein